MSRGLLVVLSGPSGVGKGAVHRRLAERLDDLDVSVSVTTRPPREGEVDGVDYRFVADEVFDRLVADDALLEWAGYAGNRYGTPRAPVAATVEAGRLALLEIEVQGAEQVRERVDDHLLVFIAPPSRAELERRLRERGTEDGAVLAQRLAEADRELAVAERFDHVVINDDLERCVDEIVGLIARARGCVTPSPADG